MMAEYEALDQEAGLDRQSNGKNFEVDQAEVTFALYQQSLAEQLRVDQPHLQNKLHRLGITSPSDIQNLQFVRNATWVTRRKQTATIGEIDLLIYRVVCGVRYAVALIEMKASGYEIHSGIQQQRLKLKQEAYLIKDSSNIFYHYGPALPEVVIATLIPKHPFLIGAEMRYSFPLIPLVLTLCSP